MQEIREQIAAEIQRALEEITGANVDPPRVEDPPRREMGDLACTAALQVAKRLGRNPRELGQELAARLSERGVQGVREFSIAGPGFLNMTLDRAAVLGRLVAGLEAQQRPRGSKVLIEHTSINPNKAAHIGHLRNACMGDTLARIYRALDYEVEVHNYIDDTGVQVADVVIGFLDLRGDSPQDVRDLPEPFDYLCWDLYTDTSERMEADAGMRERRRQVLLALECGEGIEAEMGAVVAERIVKRHLRTMARLDIAYDVLVKEGDVLRLDLWSEAFERLQKSEQVRLVEEGKHEGCWVMHLADVKGFENLEEADKVLVRSNGVATYVAKDIAYHFWKYGLLERDFTYRAVAGVEDAIETPPYETAGKRGERMGFGHADRAVTVIDVRQAYLQAVVAQAFQVIDEPEAGSSLTHFAYEMVALSPTTARALGIPVVAGAAHGFVEMSGRRGHGVKADDLINELTRRASAEVASRNPDMSAEACARTGEHLAVAAVRYFLLKYTRNAVITFDMDDALSFEGETGPYIQYAAVRAARIFDKLSAELGVDVRAAVQTGLAEGGEDLLGIREPAVGDRLARDGGELWDLILALGRYQEVIQLAAESLEISLLARYGFQLAQQFNRFYHSYPILQADDESDRALRLLVAFAFQQRLHDVLGLLGIPVPDRM